MTKRKSRRLYTKIFAPPQLIAAGQLPGIDKDMLPLAETPTYYRPKNPPKRAATGKTPTETPAKRSDAPAATVSTAAVRDVPIESYVARPPRRVKRPQLATDSEDESLAPQQAAIATTHQLARAVSLPRQRPSEHSAGTASSTTPRRLPAISSKRLNLVARICEQHIQYGMDLASRGAAESARQEFIDVLNRISQTLDYGVSDDRHSQALTAGLTALREAEDFQSGAERLATDIDLVRVVATHQTEVLKNDPILAQLTPMMALRKYLEYGKRQLTSAAGNQPVASKALYCLARLEATESKDNPMAQPISGPRAIALHQTAVIVDSRNHLAANELGVLFARYGQLQSARHVLRHATTISSEPETWYNLAKVYEMEGAPQQAAHALNKYEQLRKGSEQASKKRPEQVVNWVSPEAFRNSRDPAGLGFHERSATKLDEGTESGLRKTEVAKKQAVSERAKNGPLQSLGRLFQGQKASSRAAD